MKIDDNHLEVLQHFYQARLINALEVSIAESLCRLYQETHPYVALASLMYFFEGPCIALHSFT